MIKILTYFGQWLSDWYAIFVRELKHIFSDSGVLIIFFLAGLAMAEPQIAALTVQIIVYYILSCGAVFLESRIIRCSGRSER